jgi:hypothetical protein
VRFSQKRAIIHLNSINQLVFIIEGHYVFCKVETEFLNIFQIHFNILRDATDSLKNNMCDMAINIEIIVKTSSIELNDRCTYGTCTSEYYQLEATDRSIQSFQVSPHAMKSFY